MKESWTEIQSKFYSVKIVPTLIGSVNRKRALLLCVLNHYQILQQMEKQGLDYVGRCPFNVSWSPDHGPFRVPVASGRWRCDGCAKEGGVVEFVSRKEGIEPELAAVMVCAWFPRRWPYHRKSK